MPVTVRKNSKGGYTVSTPNGVHAKNTTKEKAEAQERLLNAVEHGWKPGSVRRVRHSPEMTEIDHSKAHGKTCRG